MFTTNITVQLVSMRQCIHLYTIIIIITIIIISSSSSSSIITTQGCD